MKKIAIIGLGFMGGSLGLAVKRFLPDVLVYGIGRAKSDVLEAKKAGAIDDGGLDLAEGVKDADVVFIAAPIDGILAILPQLKGKLGSKTIVSDLGSTKVEICRKAHESIPENFIGGHPMAGSEIAGIKGADPLLFQNAIYILTPVTGAEKIKPLTQFLEKLGANVVSISPELHDQVTAYVSHLPQMLAVSLVRLIFEKNKDEPLYKMLAAGGFRDMTRIASSSYDVWREIIQTNRLRIEEAVDALIVQLQSMKKALQQHSLSEIFQEAAQFRNELPIRSKGFINPLHRILVMVNDKKGVLAKITQTLADQNININDIELLKVREGVGGTFHLYFKSESDAANAALLLQKIGFKSRVID